MSTRLKRFGYIARTAITTGLMVSLAYNGTIDFGAVAIMLRRPWLAALNLAVFAFMVTVATLRWRLLLSLVDFKVPLRRLFALQLAADFSNAFTGIGGDVRKTLDVARDASAVERPRLLLIFIVDRLVSFAGIMALLFIRVGAHVLDGTARRSSVILFLGSVLTPLLFVHGLRVYHGRLAVWTARLDADVLTHGPSRLARVLNLFLSVHTLLSRLLTAQPKKMAVALLLSLAEHLAAMAFFIMVTRMALAREVSYWAIAVVFPLGILTTRVPWISPSGLGIGHVAFERLFLSVGLVSGATIFNIYWVCQTLPRLIFGAYPYLALKKRRAVELFSRPPADLGR